MSRQQFLVLVAAFVVISVLVAPFVRFEQDAIEYWTPWQVATANLRPWNAYAVGNCNYPPVIPYVMTLVEATRDVMLVSENSRLNLILLKLPNVASQLIGAACLFRAIRAEAGTRPATLAAAAWVSSLPMFVNAAMWCQWDAILSLFALLAVLSVRSGRPFWTGVWVALAVATKVQAIFILPAIGVYFLATRNVRAAALAVVGATIALVVCFAPMAIHGRLRDATAVYVASVDTFPRRSVNAWNPYGLINAIELRGVTNARLKVRIVSDARVVYRPISNRVTYKQLGLFLFGSYVIAMSVVIARRRRVVDVIVGVPLCGVAMFLLATQMHERYLAPPAALMALWIPLGRAYRWHFAFWSASAALNQLLTMGRYDSLGSFDPGYGFEIVGGIFACANVIAFAHCSWLFFRPMRPAEESVASDHAIAAVD